MTRARPEDQLKGLVYSLTDKPKESGIAWFKRPAIMAAAVLILTIVLNLLFH